MHREAAQCLSRLQSMDVKEGLVGSSLFKDVDAKVPNFPFPYLVTQYFCSKINHEHQQLFLWQHISILNLSPFLLDQFLLSGFEIKIFSNAHYVFHR